MKKVDLKIFSIEDIKKVSLANIPFFILIIIVIFLCFINSINGEFVSDDIPGILNNPIVINFPQALATLQIYTILQSTIFNIFGPNQAAYHTVSIFLHIINVYLFFLIVYNIFDKKIAAIASTIFAIHPLVSETVIWISATNYLINTFFLFVCTLLFLFFKKTGRKKYFIILSILYIIVCLTFKNPWVLIVPFFLAGLNFFILGESIKKIKNYYIFAPIFLIALGAFIYIGRSTVSQRVASLISPEATPYLNRLPYTFYMPAELILYPKNLSLYHEGEMITKFKYNFMAVVFFFIIISIIYFLKKHPESKVGGLIILSYISILPVFSPIQVAWFFADRYMYVAIGLFGIILAKFILYIDKIFPKKNMIIILLSVITIIYCSRTIIRTGDWKTRKKLWLATEKVAPYSQRVHNNLGDVYGVERDWEKSLQHFAFALKIDPNYTDAMHNMANTFLNMGDLDNAEKLYKRSVEITPGLYQSYYKLGVIYLARNMPDQAKLFFNKTLELQPNFTPATQALQTLQQKTQ
ncbi:hypothetical protein A2V49_02905 [candidate division WWE3 bacterium RBG_19FT_COMBO_34_6]|uniref:Glycosyltransferase RgtA/B/C/D-like domain-containing protein n=1 Tax=candidate division WWE3 bacterium RBG_19FT_COMBO_34_6 TaxID=1802612 RepID=A0A1F4UKT2_UNCKA|nr:MAG: hypothetical protein A2V49_02905 [candidate division WWE3 bacterium RBG_19FT_COMBO_34_6]